MLEALTTGARVGGEVAGAYARLAARVLLAAAFRRAIEEHEAAKDEDA